MDENQRVLLQILSKNISKAYRFVVYPPQYTPELLQTVPEPITTFSGLSELWIPDLDSFHRLLNKI